MIELAIYELLLDMIAFAMAGKLKGHSLSYDWTTWTMSVVDEQTDWLERLADSMNMNIEDLMESASIWPFLGIPREYMNR